MQAEGELAPQGEHAHAEAHAEAHAAAQDSTEPLVDIAQSAAAATVEATTNTAAASSSGQPDRGSPSAAGPSAAASSSPAAQSPPPVASRPSHPQASFNNVRTIDVIVRFPDAPRKHMQVLMDYNDMLRKPYLGGYRHTATQLTYHHASSQTPRQPRNVNWTPKNHRQTQTVYMKTRGQQGVREACTQMDRPDCLTDTTFDVEIEARPYVDAEAVMRMRAAAARTIQRYARGWMGRRRANYLKRLRDEAELFEATMAQKDAIEAEVHRKDELTRRLRPLRAEDFETLKRELEAWRLKETNRIKGSRLAADQEHAALQQLLHKETKLLQTIDRLRINANHENREANVQRMLAKMAHPKTWQAANGIKVEVHTPLTTRALELSQLYHGLGMASLSVEERLDVLLHVKWTVKEFECKLTREIVELIDREADTLNRGRNPATLEGLRRRISSLFLAFIKTPEFNPEVASIKAATPNDKVYMYPDRQYATQKAEPVPIRILP